MGCLYLGGGILILLLFVLMMILFIVVYEKFEIVDDFEFLVEIDLIEVFDDILICFVFYGLNCVSVGV